jgi:hypothetical protein
VPRHPLRPLAGLCYRQLFAFFHPFECGVDRHGVPMPEAVVFLESANDFHSLDARLQQTLLSASFLKSSGDFPVFDLTLSMYARNDIASSHAAEAVVRQSPATNR